MRGLLSALLAAGAVRGFTHDPFKKLSPADVRPGGKLRSGEMRLLREGLQSQYPDAIASVEAGSLWGSGAWGARGQAEAGPLMMQIAKAPNRMQLLLVDGLPLFFREGEDGLVVPTLRLLHCLPHLLPTCRVDRGAIKHVISGAVIMAPGIHQADPVPAGGVVAVLAEDSPNAIAVGVLLRDSAVIVDADTGPAVEVLHRLKDGLWHMGEA